MTITNQSNGRWKCASRGTVGWIDGVHMWMVRLDKKSHCVSVGISAENIDFTDASKNNHLRYDLYCDNGSVTNPDDDDTECILERFPEDGDIIFVRLDLDMGTLSFKHNNGFWKPSRTFFFNYHNREQSGRRWFPYFCSEQAGTTLSVIHI